MSHFLSPINEFASQSFWRIFIIVAALNLISTLIYNHLVWSELVYLNEVGLEVPNDNFRKGSKTRFMINLTVDAFSPLWLMVKSGIVTGLIYLISYILNVIVAPLHIMKSILASYLFVIFGDLIYSVILLLYCPPLVKNDILHFYPLSFLNFLNPSSDLNKFYPIWSRINIFQLLFIFSLYYLFRIQHNLSHKNSIWLILSYIIFYGMFLVFWLLISI
ncbi:hypothetical protein SAMN04487988_10577 [Algoriphagus hitonicola]|uniref:Yip1 domain-containing protein n=1 Tax=Algoriphagus hitonicola TaxID=435880 RepID=A0A1I2SUW5_9BACT|nr:hypothetical protein SAMN04487988_10577 [Algoriphagus hitonicola]